MSSRSLVATDADERVKLLLWSMLDYLPSPPIATGKLAAAPGPQPSRYVPCPDCAGSGRAMGSSPCVVCRDNRRADEAARRRGEIPPRRRKPRHGCRPCRSCDGQGERRRARSEEGYDPYHGKPITELEREITEAQTQSRVVLRPAAAVDDDEPWLRERARYHAAGSYEHLFAALADARRLVPRRYSLLLQRVTESDETIRVWDDGDLMVIEETIGWIADRMPRPIRVPSWVRQAARRPAVKGRGILV